MLTEQAQRWQTVVAQFFFFLNKAKIALYISIIFIFLEKVVKWTLQQKQAIKKEKLARNSAILNEKDPYEKSSFSSPDLELSVRRSHIYAELQAPARTSSCVVSFEEN